MVEQDGELAVGLEHARALGLAAESHGALDSEDVWDSYWRALRELNSFGREALEAGRALLGGEYWDRELGCDLLGTLCNPDENGWGLEIALELVTLGSSETETDVIWSLVAALGHVANPIGAPTLHKFRTHFDRDVRLAVAQAIPWCHVASDHSELGLVVETLLELMEDEHSEVRNWATFGIARLLEVDGLAIRSALLRRLNDDDEEVRVEAICGLARRRDKRSFEPLLAALESGDPSWTLVEAAGYLTDERLLGALRNLLGTFDSWLSMLEDSIRLCDPIQKQCELDLIGRVISDFDRSPHAATIEISISCPLFENWVDITARCADREDCSYSLDALIEKRCDGDPSRVPEIVAADVAKASETSSVPQDI